MKSWFSMNNLPVTLIAVGLGLNIIELATTPNTSGATGGVLFGSTGKLKGLNDSLPAVKLPGMDKNLNIGGWLILIGAAWWTAKRFL